MRFQANYHNKKALTIKVLKSIWAIEEEPTGNKEIIDQEVTTYLKGSSWR